MLMRPEVMSIIFGPGRRKLRIRKVGFESDRPRFPLLIDSREEPRRRRELLTDKLYLLIRRLRVSS